MTDRKSEPPPHSYPRPGNSRGRRNEGAERDRGGRGQKRHPDRLSRKPWCPGIRISPLSIPPVSTGKEHIRLYEHAVVVPGPVTDAVGAAARRHNIVVVLGVNERGPRLAVQHATGVRCRWHAETQSQKNHAYLPRAHDLGPRRRFRPQGRRQPRSAVSAPWHAGNTTTPSPATP